MPVAPILASLELPHCWVCNQRFIECGGDDPAIIRNRHHIVPQANGGRDGPVVTLCSAHHDMLHAIATQMLARKSWEHLLGDYSLQIRERVLYLSEVVVRSTIAVANDPNKRAQVTVELNGATRAMLQALAQADKQSLAGEIVSLIVKEHQKRFPKIPRS